MDTVPAVPARRILLAVFLGGAAGAVARVALALAWPPEPGTWPWATFAANVAGAALLGAVEARRGLPDLGRALLGPGLCGALTTFSALQVELVVLVDGGHAALAAAYAAASLAAGVAALAAGRAAAGPPVAEPRPAA
jgi:CrcB protein